MGGMGSEFWNAVVDGRIPISSPVRPGGLPSPAVSVTPMLNSMVPSGGPFTLYFPPGIYQFGGTGDSSFEFYEESTLKFAPGALFHLAPGFTLTIDGIIDADLYQIFDLTSHHSAGSAPVWASAARLRRAKRRDRRQATPRRRWRRSSA